jgi:hypothetical protein
MEDFDFPGVIVPADRQVIDQEFHRDQHVV